MSNQMTLQEGDEFVACKLAMDLRTRLEALPLSEAKEACIQALVVHVSLDGREAIYEDLRQRRIDRRSIRWELLEEQETGVIYNVTAIWRRK